MTSAEADGACARVGTRAEVLAGIAVEAVVTCTLAVDTDSPRATIVGASQFLAVLAIVLFNAVAKDDFVEAKPHCHAYTVTRA